MHSAPFDLETPRGRLLASAARLFRQKGYAATTVREIAADVGILSGSLFHHFRSKDAMLFAVMDGVIAAMLKDLNTSLARSADTRARVRALIAVELAYLHGPASNATAVLFHEWRALSAEKQEILLAGRSAYFTHWHTILTEARTAGLTSIEPEVLRQFLHGALAWSSFWFRPDGALTLEALTDRALMLALQGAQTPCSGTAQAAG